MPFAREVMLLECQIAGTSHREVKSVEETLVPGVFLVLRREMENQFDALAIMILTESGHHLGYVPRSKNEVLARLMDAGKFLFGRLETRRWEGTWLQAEVRIFLREV